ncbi:MAG: efflux RND transporter periplasmic adaptor subunit [Verrucomicrobiae bacterium]|nr:efflux RND transporter periplasmic adaptor subunit [Verrucomicrobiae bacterium]
MKNRTIFILLFATLLVGAGLGHFLGPKTPSTEAPHQHGATADQKKTVWTCAMHPQIQQPNPGKCPICAMELIPAGSEGSLGPRQFAMSAESKALARIETSPVERRLAEAEVRLVGKIDYDETRVRTIAARFPARIERLYIDFTGIQVNPGDHLAHVYSEELLTAQRELLVAARSGAGHASLVRDKLRLLGLPEDGIRAIETSGKTTDQMDIDAPIGGIVIERHITEGSYVKKGDPLFRIADLSQVWVQFDAYESDLQWLRYGQSVSFEAEAFPGRLFEGTIAFLSPALDPVTRTVKVRVNAANPETALKPGMFVRATVTSRLATGGRVVSPELKDKWISPMHPEIISDKPGDCPICGMKLVRATDLGYAVMESGEPESLPLMVPASAVLRTGKRAVVYVEVPKTEKPTYEGREIVLGARAGDFYLVESGLAEGERVVTQGAFKIDSSLQIIAKTSMMSAPTESQGHFEDWKLTAEEFQGVLKDYLDLQNALASDDLDAAKKTIESLGGHEALTTYEPASEILAKLKDADVLDAMRIGFAPLAYGLLELSKRPDLAAAEPALFEAHCPMAFDNAGSNWLQLGEDIRNPYMGMKMLKCGTIRPIEAAPAATAPVSTPAQTHQHH